MHNLNLITTLTSALAAALCMGYLTNLLRLSPIVGYLLAGIALGNHTPGYVADQHLAEQLAEVGVILLMFGVGIHFHLEDLLAVKKISAPGAILGSLTTTALGMGVAYYFGWEPRSALMFGLSLAVASTVVLTRVLADNRSLHTPTGHVAVGWLIVEDILTVLVLVLLPVFFGETSSGNGPLLDVTIAIIKVITLAASIFILGGKIIPIVLNLIARAGSQELFTLSVLVIVLGIAVGSAKLFGVSMALGAFLAGMVVGRSEFSLRAAAEALPMRDAFAVLFFVSVGMLLDPRILIENPGLVLATTAVVIIGKPIAASSIILLMGYPLKMALSIGAALAQIGEFSFILAALGKELNLFSPLATNTLVATAIIAITLNPLIYKSVGPIDNWIAHRPRLAGFLTTRLKKRLNNGLENSSTADEISDHAVIIGYGPIGKIVERLLKKNGVKVAIVELNLETIRKLLAEGTFAVYGDACRYETLKTARIAEAKTIILTSSSIHAREEVIRNARALNPHIKILARTMFIKELVSLQKSGVENVFCGEGEVALAFIEEILKNFGSTAEQIELERARVRKEIMGIEVV